MFGIDFTFLWTALNLFIIYYFIKKFLFNKLGTFMEERSASIKAGIEKSETLKEKEEQLKSQYDELVAQVYRERKDILDEARIKASKEYDELIATAKKDAAFIINEAREKSEQERNQMYKEIQKDMITLAISAASKVIEANMDNEKNRSIVEQFLSKEEAA